MKNLVLILATVFCANAAFAQSDDQVMPSEVIPAGEIKVDALKEVKVTSDAQFTTFLQSRDFGGSGDLYSLPTYGAQVSCSLTADEVALSNFKVVKTEYPARLGARFYVSAKKSITLKYKTSSVGVEQVMPTCNGEPELCEDRVPYYAYRTVVSLTDKANNSWTLNCLAPFSRSVYSSDVKINGIEIK